VGELVSEFEERAEGNDAGAAAAQLALLEAGRADAEDLLETHRAAVEPDWRAVAARAAIGTEHGEFRRQALLDGDLRVRRAAMHAALAGPVSGDLEAAFEAARLDPDPLVRSLAVRVLGAIGGRNAVSALRDVWGRAEPATRQAIVDAWAHPSSFAVGGGDQMLWVMETQDGLPAIVAAARLATASPEQRGAALGVLRRAMDQGPVDEQRLAILLAPSDKDLLPTIKKLSVSSDLQAAVMASAAWGRYPAERANAQKRLLELARQPIVSVSRQARAALVSLGDQSIVTALAKELQSDGWERRRQAAVDLLRLGATEKMVGVLADPVASVRTRVACEILTRG
jgi:HEAT repeat protein